MLLILLYFFYNVFLFETYKVFKHMLFTEDLLAITCQSNPKKRPLIYLSDIVGIQQKLTKFHISFVLNLLCMGVYLLQKCLFIFNENIFIFNEIYLYSIKKVFTFKEKYLIFKKIYLDSIKYVCFQ